MTPPQEPPMESLTEDALSAFVDGELDAREQAAVEQRLRESEEWRRVLIDVREARDMVRALPERDAPPGFWDGLLAVPGPNVVNLADASRARRSRTARWVALAAGTAAAAIIGVAAVPGAPTVQPNVAVLAGAHALRSSVGNDAISSVAGATAGPEGP